ncbi:sulfatase [Flavilitoribacter nigricans]|uniref:Sulfatase n=1 Tax=Flavilitoribacter nigricans (strain ATCC 23147 / DSM 23189 / NBRC 102662 / NCIMB 1420 / SS-2) TaxID=1122177 RepID=A0A2D0NGS1_FLAN2|nr:sulfatase [Flavilitoribacter nigricans]PHN07692.1 sulfatase [Flavilitoribacter nigricans DSM 23189 = NBRC 102662]
MNKRWINLVVLCGLGLLWVPACFPAKETASRETTPNIVLFLVDDMGWQDTSVPFWDQATDFNRLYRTPNMERLAREGMKFTQAYAASVCSPTRISLMSGMNAARHRVTNWTLRRNATNDRAHPDLELPQWNVNGIQPADSIERSTYITPLPELLRQAGYFTVHAGKAHFGAVSTPGEDPRQLGFDVNIAGHAAGGPGSYLGKNNFSAAWRDGDRIWDIPGLEKYHGQDIFVTEAITREALSSVDRAVSAEQPFYLYLAHYAVHTPLEVDDRYYQTYIDLGLDEKEARYAAMVEGMDKSLGDVMQYLDEKGIADNTIILFMSDNGGLSAVGRGGTPHTHNLPLSSGKGSAREGGIRVPMLAKWPGVTPPGSTNEQYLIIEDFFPSILEMAGIRKFETVQPVDGQSFVPLLHGKNQSTGDRPLFWHFPNNWGPSGPGIGATSTIRKGKWKLIYYHNDQAFELFDLDADIGETQNLAESFPDRVRSLATELSRYLESVDAQMPQYKATGEKVPLPAAADHFP